MFDTEGVGYGGTGKNWTWKKLNGVTIGKPYFLSGMIEPGDAGNAKCICTKPRSKGFIAIDLSSRFESSLGIKDMKLIKNFENNWNRFYYTNYYELHE